MNERAALLKEVQRCCDEARRKLRELEPVYDRYQRLCGALDRASAGVGMTPPLEHSGHRQFPIWLYAIIDGLGGKPL